MGIHAVVIVLLFVAVFGGYLMGKARGAEPLKRLKPGEYKVLGVDYSRDTVLVMVEYHVDYGHYEQCLARLLRTDFDCLPVKVGDELRVVRETPGFYFVHHAGRAA